VGRPAAVPSDTAATTPVGSNPTQQETRPGFFAALIGGAAGSQPVENQTKLVEDEDVWNEPRGVDALLGRPAGSHEGSGQ
jgi:hypothetical protein